MLFSWSSVAMHLLVLAEGQGRSNPSLALQLTLRHTSVPDLNSLVPVLR